MDSQKIKKCFLVNLLLVGMVIFAFFLAWLFYYFPYLISLGKSSFFAYHPSFFLGFLTKVGGFCELLSQFTLQFYVGPISISLLTFLALVLFCILCFYAAGYYGFLGIALYFLCANGSVPPLINEESLSGMAFIWGIALNLLAIGLWKGKERPLSSVFLKGATILVLFYLSGFLTTLFVVWEVVAGLRHFVVLKKILFLEHWILPWIGVILCVLVIFGFRNPLERTCKRVENLVDQENYCEALRLCDAYYQKVEETPKWAESNSIIGRKAEKQGALRFTLAAYTKWCLLQTGKLNDKFLEYYRIPEMGAMFPAPLPFVNIYSPIYAGIYYDLGLFAPAVPILATALEKNKFQNDLLKKFIRLRMVSGHYRLAEDYLYYLSLNPLYGRFVDSMRSINSEERSKNVTWIVERRALADTGLCEGGGFIDGWVEKAYPKYTKNKNLLNYYTLLALLQKRIEEVPALTKRYKELGYYRLPTYLQEAILLYLGPSQNRNLSGFLLDESVVKRFNLMLRDLELMQRRTISPEVFTEHYAHTYFYHFLFGQFI
ncbi:MAG: DUF6057 family protein [Bacteroidales bacterium]